jgi:2-iminobutanoate/2-iminopropanoate deaminase
MRHAISLAVAIVALALPLAGAQAATKIIHFAPSGPMPAAIPKAPPFSEAVMAGDTLYVSGTTDHDPATGKPAATPTEGAKLVLDNVKHAVEKAGLTMDDLVWVQIFAADLKDYAAFNEVYRTYFKGPMPARAFIGAGSLLGGAHFEVMGTAVRSK